jgi:hypothetical protein
MSCYSQQSAQIDSRLEEDSVWHGNIENRGYRMSNVCVIWRVLGKEMVVSANSKAVLANLFIQAFVFSIVAVIDAYPA